MNFDLGLEWLAGRSTRASVSLFRKSLTDFIFTRRTTLELSGDLFEVTRPVNGHQASLEGVEASLSHRFESGSEPLRMYQGLPSRTYRLEETGRSARLGIKFRF